MTFEVRGFSVSKCPRCGKWWGREAGRHASSCTAIHFVGDCCHMGESELTEESVAAMFTTFHEATTGTGHWPRASLAGTQEGAG